MIHLVIDKLLTIYRETNLKSSGTLGYIWRLSPEDAAGLYEYVTTSFDCIRGGQWNISCVEDIDWLLGSPVVSVDSPRTTFSKKRITNKERIARRKYEIASSRPR